ncbi:MAG: acetyl-CoA carboxylase carboxyltransferase subunit alpha [Thermoleophilia bacterium]|nr:acetyl-CoA carboxylase carboxyltransferase subunit alpha [Thermoleophilia bacterium]
MKPPHMGDIGGRFRRFRSRLGGSAEPEADDVWKAIQLARHAERPYPLDYIARLMPDFEELHGDRLQGDDHAIVAGIGRYHGRPTVVIGQQKGRDAEERVFRNFAMSGPGGYRKAMRVMELAEKLRAPVVTLIDTPGAFAGAQAEINGQGGAIAQSMQTMMRLRVPSIAVIVGEGSSGGALALGVADRVVMLENSTYSVISPEGASAILWRDAGKAQLAAAAFKPTAANCYRWGVADAVVPEPEGGAHTDHDEAARLLDGYLSRTLRNLIAIPDADRVRQRRDRFRRLGAYRELPTGGTAIVVGVDDPRPAPGS